MKNKPVLVVLGIISIALIILMIYTYIEYGGKPISEVPAWAFWIMKGK